jgi:hypothetical protein
MLIELLNFERQRLGYFRFPSRSDCLVPLMPVARSCFEFEFQIDNLIGAASRLRTTNYSP